MAMSSAMASSSARRPSIWLCCFSIIRSRRLSALLRLFGDLAQGDDRVLVVVAIDGHRRAGRDLAARWAASMTSSNRLGTLSTQIFRDGQGHGASSLGGRSDELLTAAEGELTSETGTGLPNLVP